MRPDDDPFYTHDEFGRPLDADTVARRKVLKAMKHMSPDERFQAAVDAGIYHPDGTLTEHYRDDGEPSKYRPTD